MDTLSPAVKILVVEDEKVVALDLKRCLIKLGYQVIGTAASAANVYSILEQQIPDLILMDIHIQGNTDGIELTKQICERFSIPVIYLTAYSEEATLSRASSTKPYGYLLKPFSERELYVSIQVALERFDSDRQLQISENHLNLALDAAELSTWEAGTNSDKIFLTKSPKGVLAPLGSWQRLYNAITEDDKPRIQQAIEALRYDKNQQIELEFKVRQNKRSVKWLKLYGKSFRDKYHQTNRIVGVIQDVTDRHQIEERLARAATVFRCTAEGIVILDRNRTVDSINTAFTTITGYRQQHLEGRELPLLSDDVLTDEQYRNIWEQVDTQGHWQGELKGYRENSDVMHTWVNVSTVPDDQERIAQYVVIVSDISAIREAQDKLSHIAYFDSLTDLPNRALLMDRLDHTLAKAHREHDRLALLFIDLDHFKRVNDTLGHQLGDQMIRTVAQRLKTALRATDTLGRLGGDEFIVIIDDIDSADDAIIPANKIADALAAPITLANTRIVPSCSIGISIYPDDSDNRDALIRMADTAMYAAKESGRGRFAFYSPEMTEHTAHYLTRENELRTALEHNQFQLFYQPQIDTAHGLLCGMEALIRWQHPERGLLCASEIIPVAESSALIIEIGNWVAQEACKQLAEWIAEGLTPVRIAINTSIRQLADGKLPLHITRLLDQHQLPAELLEIEVTESCLQDSDACLATLNKLKQIGLSISIDDFGTGYSCMSSLKMLPIHRLKIDQSFVKDIPQQADDCAIASAIVALGHQLNLKIVAEGVENKAQADYLAQINCDELQGHFFSKPMSAASATDYLRQQLDTSRKHSS